MHAYEVKNNLTGHVGRFNSMSEVEDFILSRACSECIDEVSEGVQSRTVLVQNILKHTLCGEIYTVHTVDTRELD